ncbi:putative GTP binding protein [Aspergillus campestris IBT 28561]|uniref:GTP binding protein n=1 Tax=Aspergillus campestris (strain IBT 28561) TaxID=1392248 RepID=A0A2I1D112_ASPC2|nr:putative GTP binding protein [Aspergillus campestris IBT 28561]PKY03557.1 putative GTP binding protein [Aspergillus campestris IBT 28561]
MRRQKPSVEERRRGEVALSEFAEYAEQQQSHRAALVPPSDSGYSTGAPSKTHDTETEDHAELEILDQLSLSDAPKTVKLKELLLGTGDGGDESLQQLASFLQARIDEGHGETIFDLGLEDGGEPMGFDHAQWETAVRRLRETADTLPAHCRILMTYNVGGPQESPTKKDDRSKDAWGKVLIRQPADTVEEMAEIRVAVVGNVDAGKSTMLGVLVKGNLDDGRGRARVNLFRHQHEIESGRTSSVGMEIMGFDSHGEIVSSAHGRKVSWEEVGRRSAKVISFSDLAGHEKYLRTTVFGMLSSSPNYCLLMVAANNGLVGMSKEHLGIALALNVPVMVIVTKIDICPPQVLQETLTQLTKILKSPGARKIPIMVKDMEETINTAGQFVSQRICPIFQVSNVTGENLDLVRTFLNILPHRGHYNDEAPFEFLVNDTFSVPHVGTVVSGVAKSGVIHAGDTVLVGPDSLGQFTTTTLKSIERKRIPVNTCHAGQSGSFALKRVRRKEVRKGMVVLKKLDQPPKVYREFIAEVLILSHATTIKPRYQAMLHVGAVSQTCSVIDIDRPFIRTGDRAVVAFRFVQRPEFLAPGDRVLFREGKTKGLGIVKSVGYDPNQPLNVEAKQAYESKNG